MILYLFLLLPWLRIIKDDANIDDHVVLEILVSCNQCIATLILKANAVRGTFVEAVEVLNSSYD